MEINTPELDADQGLVELPSTPTDPSTQIATGCATAADNFFVVTGRGNLPESPRTLGGHPMWDDLRSLEVDSGLQSSEQASVLLSSSDVSNTSLTSSEHFLTELDLVSKPLIEATGLLLHEHGEVELVVATTAPTINQMTFYGGTCMKRANL